MRVFIVTFLLLTSTAVWAAAGNLPLFHWDAPQQGAFIVSLMADKAGRIFVGTEDNGVWRFDPAAADGKQWTQFTRKDGLGDDNGYALAVDNLGRVWVGHLNHGVSVYNGQAWHNYSVLDGPVGERVFAIATCPTDGDVWIATNVGLSRYALAKDQWTYYTRAEGLPSSQTDAIAFDASGNIYVGTQADGLIMADAADNYKTWRNAQGPSQPTLTYNGSGLPSNLINDVLVAKDGTVYVATNFGLGHSVDGGKTWTYSRGRDWADKVKGRYGGAPPQWQATEGASLAEDYCTCLAEDAGGTLWVGHRQQGFEVLDPKTGQSIYDSKAESELKDPEDYVQAILPLPGQAPLIGRYGGGVVQPTKYNAPLSSENRDGKAMAPVSGEATPPWPKPVGVPTLAELNTLLREVGTAPVGRLETLPPIVALDDDWTTQGDWLGRYGRYWACLAAIRSPKDYVWGAGWERTDYAFYLGLNATANDVIRRYVSALYTDNPRSLELPPVYLDTRIARKLTSAAVNRRQAEVDDHGEVYPMSQDGPGVYCSLRIPAGVYYLSLYDVNKDGHQDNNRYRDYRISVRPHRAGSPLTDIKGFSQQPELSAGRIKDFWHGVWKRFLVRGPTEITIEVNRNYSFNTLLGGVMLDLVAEKPAPYFYAAAQWKDALREEEQERLSVLTDARIPAIYEEHFKPAPTTQVAEDRLFDELERMRLANPFWWAAAGRRCYAPLLRWYLQDLAQPHTPAATLALYRHLATCYYAMELYELWEKYQKLMGLTPAREIEKALRWEANDADGFGIGYQSVTAYLNAKGH